MQRPESSGKSGQNARRFRVAKSRGGQSRLGHCCRVASLGSVRGRAGAGIVDGVAKCARRSAHRCCFVSAAAAYGSRRELVEKFTEEKEKTAATIPSGLGRRPSWWPREKVWREKAVRRCRERREEPCVLFVARRARPSGARDPTGPKHCATRAGWCIRKWSRRARFEKETSPRDANDNTHTYKEEREKRG